MTDTTDEHIASPKALYALEDLMSEFSVTLNDLIIEPDCAGGILVSLSRKCHIYIDEDAKLFGLFDPENGKYSIFTDAQVKDFRFQVSKILHIPITE